MKVKVDGTFNVQGTLECGQAFRYSKIEDNTYELVANSQRLILKQCEGYVDFECEEDRFEKYWRTYFDLDTNYKAVQERLIQIDPRLQAYIDFQPGIRIIRQDPFEMMITFILSQNKSMPQIMQLVKRISESYGTVYEDEQGIYYGFPNPNQLVHVTEEAFRSLKVGFRAPYLVDAIAKVTSGEIDLASLDTLDTNEAREILLQVKGIGRKVSDCILLFGYHKMDVFPLDVWMKRAMKALYFVDEKVSDKVMLEKANELYGDLSGIAQQYIFNGYVHQLN